jgi:hypothetical protein
MLVGGIIVAAVVALAILIRPAQRTPSAEPPPLTSDQKAYLGQIEVSDASMSAAENYLGQTVFYLNAKLTNKGSKVVRRLDLELEFHDVLDQVVLRDAAHPLRSGSTPLKPGETRAFVVAFERLPSEWNQAPPHITPAYVGF